MTPTLKELLNVATEAAYIGGRRTLAYFGTNVAVETKADQTPVTIADKESEAAIRAIIAKHYPTHTVLGEEGGLQTGDPDYKWIIDPIDGTKTFIAGVPMYGVMIGLEVRGEPRVGVVYHPATNEMLCAAHGLGCNLNGRAVHVSEISKIEEARVLVTDAEHCARRTPKYTALANRAKFTRTWGDCYGYTLVATGRAEIMLDAAMNPWDCAPLLTILEEAGGRFTDWNGTATIHGNDAMGTNGLLHAEVLKMLGE